jgi:hypothetical protein
VTFIPTGGIANQTTEYTTITAPKRDRLRHAQLPTGLNLDSHALDDGLGSVGKWECGTPSSASELAWVSPAWLEASGERKSA